MRSKERVSLCWLVVTLAFFGVAADPAQHASAAQVVFVKADASGSNNGSSWTNAYRDLQGALGAAEWGDEIWVGQGTYKPTTGTDRNISFVMEAGVGLHGGFAGTETARAQRNWTTNPTILSGDIGTPGTATDNSYRVVNVAFDHGNDVARAFQPALFDVTFSQAGEHAPILARGSVKSELSPGLITQFGAVSTEFPQLKTANERE